MPLIIFLWRQKKWKEQQNSIGLEQWTEIPASEEDLMAHLTAPDVRYEEGGSVWLHWFDQSLDITDRFEDGVCYVKLVNNGEPLYMTVKYENGYATSSHKYVSPWEFN